MASDSPSASALREPRLTAAEVSRSPYYSLQPCRKDPAKIGIKPLKSTGCTFVRIGVECLPHRAADQTAELVL